LQNQYIFKSDVYVDIPTILLIALGLAMDAFAVSIAHGMTLKTLRNGNALKMAAFFGSFQAVMPVLGWLAGLSLLDLISGVDHWAAFGLLFFIGCKMIYESFKTTPNEKEQKTLTLSILLMLSVATSIDALAVGLSFAFLKIAIAIPIVIIGAVTFLLSFLGVTFGNKFGKFLGNKIEIVGGLVLVTIGMKILLEHTLLHVVIPV
jgi:putative Mn2+ efflux pump MntP